jgi:uncharacterized protein YjbI with pentapeptide repeats
MYTAVAVRCVVAVLLAGCALAIGLASDAAATIPARTWYHEAEFGRDPSLRATTDAAVILHLRPSVSILERTAHTIPYRFAEAETLTFCIPPDDPHVEELTLTADEGRRRRVVRVTRGGGCRTATVAAGRYELTVLHRGGGIEPAGKKAFVHVPRTGKVLGEGTHAGSLPACGTDLSNLPLSMVQAPNGQFVAASLTGAAGPCGSSPFPLCAAAPAANPTSSPVFGTPITAWAICPDDGGHYTWAFYAVSPQPLDVGGPFDAQNGWLVPNVDPPLPFKLSDLANAQFTMQASFAQTLYPVGIDPATGTLSYKDQSAAVFTHVAAFYESAATTPLAAGQVALFVPDQGPCKSSFEESASAWGTWVVNLSIPDLSILVTGGLNVPIGTLLACMQVGPGTIATLYTETNYQGTSEVVGEDTLALQLAGQVKSLKLTPARQFIVATNACASCNLSGVDLSGLTLTGGSFPNSTFSGANLGQTKLDGAALDHADFSGAATTLAGADFTGSTLHCAKFIGADLTAATFGAVNAGTQLTTDFSCRLDLTTARLTRASLPPAVWRYLDLSGAAIAGLTGAPLSTPQDPLDLRGAILSGVNLAEVQLDSANLGCVPATETYNGTQVCTQLVQTTLFKATLRQATLVSANLQGATLDYANLAGANLCTAQLNESPTTRTSASLVGAQLKNVNLAGADLGGATFSSANFYSEGPGSCVPESCALSAPCATATGATMNSTDFSGAYLNGVDMSGGQTTAQGANFSGALLVGVDFSNANLSNDPLSGSPTKFIGAFLQGSDFTGTNVANANFTDAFVTPETGATMIFQLDASAHAAFAGYRVTPGATPGCVLFTYDQPITLPTTDSGNTCPSGQPGPCQPTDWTSPTIPVSQALPPSTSDGATLPTGCQRLDTSW